MTIKAVLIKQMNVALPIEDFYVVCNGKLVGDNETFIPDKKYCLVPRLIGGKGGFGSMLRAIGAQIEKTTNREACRDLRGRRMRDVNNEKKLREWGEKIGEREREKTERRRLKRERVNNRGAPHKFEDEKYYQQKEQIKQNMEDAMQQALSKGGDTKGKKKAEKGKLNRNDINFVFGDEISDLSDDEILQKKVKICELEDGHKSNIECTIIEESDSSSSSSNIITQNQRISQENSGLTLEIKSLIEEENMIVDGRGFSTIPNPQIMNTQVVNTIEMPTINSDISMKLLTENTIEMNTICKDILINTESISTQDKPTMENDLLTKTHKPFDLMEYPNVESLESLGLDHLKNELTYRGLKCGGSLNERAARLFSIKGLDSNQIPNNLKAKGNKK